MTGSEKQICIVLFYESKIFKMFTGSPFVDFKIGNLTIKDPFNIGY